MKPVTGAVIVRAADSAVAKLTTNPAAAEKRCNRAQRIPPYVLKCGLSPLSSAVMGVTFGGDGERERMCFRTSPWVGKGATEGYRLGKGSGALSA